MSEMPTPGRNRLSQVFQYLRALNQLRNPVPGQIAEQPWSLWLDELPEHPSVRKGRGFAPESGEDEAFVLRVERPATTPAPVPSPALAPWLRAGWEKPEGEVHVDETRRVRNDAGFEQTEAFGDSAERTRAWADYQPQWMAWAQNERPVRLALKVFERLYALHGQLEREGERLELVLGDGLLNWRRAETSVHHPVLGVRLALDFEPAVPAFTLRESDRPVELYTALFAGMPDVEGRVLAQWNDALSLDLHHPLGGEDTTSLMRTLVSLLSSQGELVAPSRLRADGDHPRIARRPVVYARSRTLGYASALEGILENLEADDALPPALLRMMGCEEEAGASAQAHLVPDADVLFCKPANPEQYRIAEQLDKHGAVLVQGPPGTGKSYTIGNLVGHLLAQGKTVLVTSHTTKALQVVREHVVPQLRPLCVSVLDRDDESRKQLESAVGGIVERLSGGGEDLGAQAEGFARTRTALRERLDANRAARLDALQGETRAIAFGGEAIAPSEAAHWVATHDEHAWLPGPLTPGAPLPLTEGEVLSLYHTNGVVDARVEQALDARLPAPAELADPATFAHVATEIRRLSGTRPVGAELWTGPATESQEEALQAVAEALQVALALLDGALEWELAIAAAGVTGGVYQQPWEDLCRQIEATTADIGRHQALILSQGPTLDPGIDRAQALPLLREMAEHVAEGGNLGGMALLFKGPWKRVLAGALVNGAAPHTEPQLEALVALAARDVARTDLRSRWERQVGPLGGPPGQALGPEPEMTAPQFVTRIRALAGWHGDRWRPVLEALNALGFRWDTWLDKMPPEPGATGPVRRLSAAARGLQALISARMDASRGAAMLARYEAWLQALGRADAGVQVIGALRAAFDGLDAEGYATAWHQLSDLHDRRSARSTRDGLLARLEPVAPSWAAALRGRMAPHDATRPPGDAGMAWKWRQLSEELDRRQALSLDRLQLEAEALMRDMHESTSSLIDRRAWAAQKTRTTLPQQQALIGWMQTIKKIGAGTGKRVPALQAEARRLMADCQSAIPVWIMPLARVAENFDPRHTRFDVVIIDEASQSDAMALAALYLGKQVVVVGDDQQVSPDAVGQKVDEVKQLIDTHLRGIPNAHLYDGQLSVYDLALASFGGSICLLEHFRCVPDIIEFSNHLSYDGRLKALREATSAKVAPAVVPHYVAGAASERKVNRLEAAEVASLVAAAMEQPEYTRKQPLTFGVISLVGDEQALEIESILRRRLPPQELERRRLLCGNPAQFQGDERDVVFLSMVDAPGEGPLSMRQDARFKKRFNVAASRSRDQLWVVHSLDPNLDLKPGDLRRRLIEHARSPWAIASSVAKAEQAVESPFEQAVLRRLVSAGYRVKAQWPVGHYRIDLVVEGGGKRLAIECDGERFHPIETLAADLERQAILERLGWKFSRLRGSLFFRDADAAMAPVFERLSQLGIPPEGPEGHTAVTPGENALTARIVQRAAALRAEWLAADTVEGRMAVRP